MKYLILKLPKILSILYINNVEMLCWQETYSVRNQVSKMLINSKMSIGEDKYMKCLHKDTA